MIPRARSTFPSGGSLCATRSAASIRKCSSAQISLSPRCASYSTFVQRWQVEVTFEEARRHLGLETQRQWSDRAIAGTTPVLLSLFTLVALLATRLVRAGTLPMALAAWYQKPTPTFSDALAAVRAELWRHQGFYLSTVPSRIPKPARRWLARLTDALCHGA